MVQRDEDEDVWYDSIGHIRRRGDDSRSPSHSDGRGRGRSASEDRLNRSSPSHHSPRSSGSRERGRPLTQHAEADAEPSSPPSHRKNYLITPTTSDSTGLSFVADYINKATGEQAANASRADRTTNTRSLKVKEPTDDEDLTKDEFAKYQAQYEVRRKISKSQILQGTSDEDAEDPTLGNRRAQTHLSEDGTIERRDFDSNGRFEYSPLGESRKAKMPERRGRSIEELTIDN